MIIRYSFVLSMAALVVGSAFWITHLRVQEQEEIGTGRLMSNFVVTLLGISLLALFFGVLLFFVTYTLAMAVMAPSLGRLAVVLYALILSAPLGAIAAIAVMWRSSKSIWERSGES